MFKKFQEWAKRKEEAIKKEQELRKAKRFYSFVKAGATFIKFVCEDLKKNQDNVNRHMRRRMQKDLNEKGVLSEELVGYYQAKIDYILAEVDRRLNPPKQPKSQVQANPSIIQPNSNIQISKEKPKNVA
jgi:hypothetical protein